jgi:hypothetical protein
MEENRKVIITGIIFILVVAAAVVVYFLFIRGGKGAPVEEVTAKAPQQVSLDEALKGKEEVITEFAQMELDKSDDSIREQIKELSSHPKLARWLMTKDIIRKFTAAVDNIANGLSPIPQIDFFTPGGEFEVTKRNGDYKIDSKSFRRYDSVADAFLSLNTEGCLKLYRQAKPLIQKAYIELGYPTKDFDETLLRAMVELLKVPIVEGDMVVKKGVVTYIYADSRLEKLSEAQKHLLRMGPENVRIIQEKLRELASEFGFPQDKLPSPETY